MKAAVMQGPKQFVIKDIPKHNPGASEVIMRVRACSICGSDLSVYKMGVPDRVLGHEFSGDIVELGNEVTNWEIGDRVVVEPSIICGKCYWCKHQQYNLCDSLEYTGLASDGGFAQYARVPAYQLHRLPAELSYLQGALIEPLAVALRGVRLAELAPGNSAAVFGCGAIGLFTLLWARHNGAGNIIATDIAQSRLAAAKKLADAVLNASEVDIAAEVVKLTDDLGPDIIFECSGNTQAQSDAANSVRKGGRIILLGIGYEPTPLMFMQLTMREISLKGSLGYLSLGDRGEFDSAIQALQSKQIDLAGIPILTCKLEELGNVFEGLLHGDIAKAIVLP